MHAISVPLISISRQSLLGSRLLGATVTPHQPALSSSLVGVSTEAAPKFSASFPKAARNAMGHRTSNWRPRMAQKSASLSLPLCPSVASQTIKRSTLDLGYHMTWRLSKGKGNRANKMCPKR
ncbi:hypothetical protein LY78DRAFT_289166 [Colletotrichum sublineola]|nr:hypothetical protein LY78DRAFT_289166 [Colletotrichum sublineola]